MKIASWLLPLFIVLPLLFVGLQDDADGCIRFKKPGGSVPPGLRDPEDPPADEDPPTTDPGDPDPGEPDPGTPTTPTTPSKRALRSAGTRGARSFTSCEPCTDPRGPSASV